jgi:serine protease AprX
VPKVTDNSCGPTGGGAFDPNSATALLREPVPPARHGPDRRHAQVAAALKTTAYEFTDGAAYEAGPLGTTSFDKDYGLVDVVAAADAVR